MVKKVYDITEMKRLYKKYGTLRDVSMRMGCASCTVKKILIENGVTIKKYVPTTWDIKERFTQYK